MRSLILYSGERVVYESDGSGLRPLLLCILENMGKYEDCRLFDKVIGLAAARLIVYSKMIADVDTLLASRLAIEHLEKNSIEIKAEKIVDNILTEDKEDTCPMEKKATAMEDKEFFDYFKRLALRTKAP